MKKTKRFFCILLFFCLLFCVDRSVGKFIYFGIERYFGLSQYSEVLLLGHSHLMLATDKQQLEKKLGRTVSKYCREGVNVADRYEMVKQYLSSPYSDSLKVILYGVDQFIFTGEGLSRNSYKLFYPFMDEENVDQYIRQSTDKKDYWIHKLVYTTRYSDALLNSAIRGWRNDWSNYKEGQLDVSNLKEEIVKGHQRKIHFEQRLIDSFDNTLEMITRKGIRVVLVNTPIAKILNESDSDAYKKIIQFFKDKAASSPLIYYWDMNPEYSGQYQLFFDPIHLNPLGQQVINRQIIENFRNELNDSL